MRFVSAPAWSLCAKCRDPLLDKTLHLLLGDRLGVGFGESLPEEVGEFVFGQLAVLICVGCGKQRVKPGVSAMLRQPGKSGSARARMSARSPFAPVVEGGEPSATQAALTQSVMDVAVSGKVIVSGNAMLTESVSGKPVPRKSVMAKAMVAPHRVPRETATVAAFMLPTVMRPSTAMAGPTV